MKSHRTGISTVTLSALVALSLFFAPMAKAQGGKGHKAAKTEVNAVTDPKDTADSLGVAITIYNQNFGLVKDIRNFELKEGINKIRFEDVAAAMDPTSVSFTSLTAPNSVVVREQNYQYDLMDSDTILSKSVGKEIKFRQYTASGGVHEVLGTLLNAPNVTVSDSNGNISQRTVSPVVKTSSGIVVAPAGEIEIAELPAGLVAKPSLLWKLECDKAGTHKTEITYQTQGLNWKCDYVAVANNDDSKIDLTSWVTLDNKSGASYKDATLKLMAGDVHKVPPPVLPRYALARAASFNASAAPQFSEESFSEYHLYSLANQTDVLNNETKQLSLFNASEVPVKKLYIFDSAQPFVGNFMPPGSAGQKVNVKLELLNSKDNNLGMAMPKGKVRVYKRDKDGALQFVGEDQIDHTPKDEKVRVYIGDAFDIVGERKQTNSQQSSARVNKSSMEISLRNHKESPVTVTCVEHAYGDWKILASSQNYTKKDAHTFEFVVQLPANQEVKVTYDLETRN